MSIFRSPQVAAQLLSSITTLGLQTKLKLPRTSQLPLLLRSLNTKTDGDSPPKAIKLKDGGKRLELWYHDGQILQLPSEYLRVMSPSADTQDRKDAHGKTRVVSGRRHVGILGVEPVGGYAIRIKFDDLHQAGIYSWSMLHDLGTNKWTHMRRYIQQLRSRGLSRNPVKPAKTAIE